MNWIVTLLRRDVDPILAAKQEWTQSPTEGETIDKQLLCLSVNVCLATAVCLLVQVMWWFDVFQETKIVMMSQQQKKVDDGEINFKS